MTFRDALPLLIFLVSYQALAAPNPDHDPNSAIIKVEPFAARVTANNFDLGRFALAIDCSPSDRSDDGTYTQYIELKVRKSSSGGYKTEMPSASQFDVKPDSGLCSVTLSAFRNLSKFNSKVDISIYGTFLLASDLAKRDIASDVMRRLRHSVIVGKTLKDYPYFNDRVEHTEDHSANFCVQILGRRYRNPNSTSLYKILSFGEMPTTKKMNAGGVTTNGKGYGGLYYSCDDKSRALVVEMNDPNFQEKDGPLAPPSAWQTLEANFSPDLSAMILNGNAWASIPRRIAFINARLLKL